MVRRAWIARRWTSGSPKASKSGAGVPRGRWAEDGPIPHHYPLWETRSEQIHVRTQRNVECSTASLVLTRGTPMGGTRLTVECAQSMRRPLLVVDLGLVDDHVTRIVEWLRSVEPRVLNVAGPRESGAPGIGEQAAEILREVLDQVPELSLFTDR